MNTHPLSTAIRNRVIQRRRMKGAELLAHPHNARQHPKQQADALRDLLATIGQVGELYAYPSERHAGRLTLLDGHLRIEQFADQEWDVAITDLNDAEADLLLLTRDRITELATWDQAAFEQIMERIDLPDESTLTAMLKDLEKEIADLTVSDDPKKKGDEPELTQEYSVLVHCASERDQRIILEELNRHNLQTRALIVDFPVIEKREPKPGPKLAEGEIEIVRRSAIQRTARVMQCEGLFDIPPAERAEERWRVKLQLDRPWNIGLIVGPSGSGKTTVARELFATDLISTWPWTSARAVIDDFPADMSIAEITGLLSSVGFSSPPSWLKPFHVLSNGEQFRVNLARTLAEKPDLAVVDEFTSVVDRTVARVGSAAFAKTIRAAGRKCIAVACHYDIEDWLQPDWKLEMPNGEITWRALRRRPELQLRIHRTDKSKWPLFRRHHYLSHDLHPGAQCFLAEVEGQPASFTAVLHFPHQNGGFWREHRTVCLPDFQGVGIGNAVSEYIASLFIAKGKPYHSTTSHPAMIRHRLRSPLWRCKRAPSMAPQKARSGHSAQSARAAYRLTAGFEYIGPPRAQEAAAFGLLN